MSRTLAAVMVCVALLIGCGGGSSSGASEPVLPAEDTFLDGDCRTAAPDVLTIGRLLPRLESKGAVDQEVKDGVRDAEAVLGAIAGGADAPYKGALDDIVAKLGVVLGGLDSDTYQPAQGEQLRRSYDALVRVCTTAG